MAVRYNARTTKCSLVIYVVLVLLLVTPVAFVAAVSCWHLRAFSRAMGNDHTLTLLVFTVVMFATIGVTGFGLVATVANGVGILTWYATMQVVAAVIIATVALAAGIEMRTKQCFHPTLREDMELAFAEQWDSKSMDSLQIRLRCCGVHSPMDYGNVSSWSDGAGGAGSVTLPVSCCRIPELGACPLNSGDHWMSGCFAAVLVYLLHQYYVMTLAGTVCSMCVAMGASATYVHSTALYSLMIRG